MKKSEFNLLLGLPMILAGVFAGVCIVVAFFKPWHILSAIITSLLFLELRYEYKEATRRNS